MPTLRGIWDTFPLLQSGAAGFVPMGPEPSFTSGCTHLEVGERDPVHSVLTTQNPLGKHGGAHAIADLAVERWRIGSPIERQSQCLGGGRWTARAAFLTFSMASCASAPAATLID